METAMGKGRAHAEESFVCDNGRKQFSIHWRQLYNISSWNTDNNLEYIRKRLLFICNVMIHVCQYNVPRTHISVMIIQQLPLCSAITCQNIHGDRVNVTVIIIDMPVPLEVPSGCPRYQMTCVSCKVPRFLKNRYV